MGLWLLAAVVAAATVHLVPVLTTNGHHMLTRLHVLPLEHVLLIPGEDSDLHAQGDLCLWTVTNQRRSYAQTEALGICSGVPIAVAPLSSGHALAGSCSCLGPYCQNWQQRAQG